MADLNKLVTELGALGWEVVPHGEGTLHSRQLTDEGEINIYLRVNDNWLMASVVPFLSTHGDNSFDLSRWLLRMNRDMFQTKFAYDEDGDVILTAELPTESLDPSEIREALQSLVRYAIQHRATLRAAARKKETSSP